VTSASGGVDGTWIEGRNPVAEALRAKRPLNKVVVARGARGAVVSEIVGAAKRAGVPVQFVRPDVLDAMSRTRSHQGVIALAAAVGYVDPLEILKRVPAGDDPLILVLDGVQDPQNLGSLLRSADAFGVHGVIIPRHRSASLTPGAVKAAAGATEYVPVSRVGSVRHQIERLEREGLWVVGAAPDAKLSVDEARLDGPLAVVLGGERRGMSAGVKRACDCVVRIPMYGSVESLNVAVAGAVLLAEVRERRRRAAGSGTRHKRT